MSVATHTARSATARADDTTRLRLLYELGCAFAARVDLHDLCALVVAKCREVLDAEGAAILLHDPERDELYFPYVADADPDVAARLLSLRFPADRGIAGAVLRSGRSVRVDDVARDPRFYGGVDRHTGLTTSNLLCAPLSSRAGTIGVVQVLNRRDGGFTDDDLAFLDALAGSVAVAIENARLYAQLRQQVAALEQAVHEHNELLAIRRELDIARSIQQSILPRSFPPFPQRTDFDIFAAMIPAREVGGDFYDFFLIDAERLGFVIGDVSGKGVPAALFMAVSRTLLKSIALEGRPPGDCLQRVNALLCLDNSAEMFVTLFYGILNTRSGELVYANGGHNPPYFLRHDGRVEALESTGGMVLGVLDGIRFQAKQAMVRPGDAIFLYTDGVTEAMDSGGELFSSRRLLAWLGQRSGAAPAEIIRDVVDAVNRYSSDVPQSDDITLLAIRRPMPPRGMPPSDSLHDQLTLTVENRLSELERVSHLVQEFSERHGLSAKQIFALTLALDEVLTNVITYAYDDGAEHAITVRLLRTLGELTIEVEDDGRPFNPLEVVAPDTGAPIEQRQLGGLGIHLVRNVVDRLDYHRQGGRNRLVIRKSIVT